MDIGAYHFLPYQEEEMLMQFNQEQLKDWLYQMLLIRQFEVRAEAAYLQGLVGGFFHAYIGQEAVQTAAIAAIGKNNWWITSYRCHALALLLGADPKELMAELYGKETGNAKGRGGSMHFYTEKMLGGFGIVGGQIPIAIGAAFSAKYQQTGEVAICFLGDGAVAQGAFHESLNIAALWNLPCIFVIENNQWGMGTAVQEAICVHPIAETKAKGYNVSGYTLDGMDFLSCYHGFSHILHEVKKSSRPVLVEVITERFRGHSISDSGAAYRTKEEVACIMKKDPLLRWKEKLIARGIIAEEEYKQKEGQIKQRVLEALEFAQQSPWPNPEFLEQDLFCPEKRGV